MDSTRQERLEALDREANANELIARYLEKAVAEARKDYDEAGSGDQAFYRFVLRKVTAAWQDYREGAKCLRTDAQLIAETKKDI